MAEKTAFEKELDAREAKARADFEQRTTGLDATPNDDAVAETATLEPAAPEVTSVVDTPPAPSAAPVPTDIVDGEAPAPEKPVAAPKEAAPAAPEEKERRVNWKQARDAERAAKREIKQLRDELNSMKAAKGQPADVPPAPVATDDDPLGIKSEVNRLRDEISQQNRQRQALDEQDRITRDLVSAEDQYRRTQPHGAQYDKAVEYIVKAERARYELTGEHLVRGKMLLDAAEKFGDTDNRAKVLREAIERTADERDITDSEAAAYIATDLWIANQRNLIINGCRANNKSIPDTVWQIASTMGFKPEIIDAVPAPARNAAPAQTPAEKVRATVRASEAGKSLGSIPGGSPRTPDQPAIRTVAEWASFFQKDPAGARQYAAAMMKTDPNWHRNLAAR